MTPLPLWLHLHSRVLSPFRLSSATSFSLSAYTCQFECRWHKKTFIATKYICFSILSVAPSRRHLWHASYWTVPQLCSWTNNPPRPTSFAAFAWICFHLMCHFFFTHKSLALNLPPPHGFYYMSVCMLGCAALGQRPTSIPCSSSSSFRGVLLACVPACCLRLCLSCQLLRARLVLVSSVCLIKWLNLTLPVFPNASSTRERLKSVQLL